MRKALKRNWNSGCCNNLKFSWQREQDGNKSTDYYHTEQPITPQCLHFFSAHLFFKQQGHAVDHLVPIKWCGRDVEEEAVEDGLGDPLQRNGQHEGRQADQDVRRQRGQACFLHTHDSVAGRQMKVHLLCGMRACISSLQRLDPTSNEATAICTLYSVVTASVWTWLSTQLWFFSPFFDWSAEGFVQGTVLQRKAAQLTETYSFLSV